MEETIHETLAQGLSGWEVTDVVVRLTHAGFSSVMSTGSDFRRLTPFVLMQALARAGTTVCEPYDELELEIPEESYGPVCGALINARATLRASHREGDGHRLVCDIPTGELRAVEQQLPGLTRGDGGWVSRFAGYVAVQGDLPARPRAGPDVFNRAAYLAEVGRGRPANG
jgi:ribosomal protection tetracycline resistance protein